MSEEPKLDKKSIQDLEKEKLQAEINILKAKLKSEYPVNEPEGYFNRVAGFAQKWSAFILGSVTLISAIWGVFVPLSEYLDARRNALEYNLNENMIRFVKGLNSYDTDTAKQSVMMLSYYETNSIPILLYYFENSEIDYDVDLRAKIIETISMIYDGNKNKKIIEEIIRGINISFDNLKTTGSEGNQMINEQKRNALGYYMEMLPRMKLTDRHKSEIRKTLVDLQEKMCKDIFLMDEAKTYFDNICVYVYPDDSKQCECN